MGKRREGGRRKEGGRKEVGRREGKRRERGGKEGGKRGREEGERRRGKKGERGVKRGMEEGREIQCKLEWNEAHTFSCQKWHSASLRPACPPSRPPSCSIILPNESVIKPGSERVGGAVHVRSRLGQMGAKYSK